MSGSGCMYFRFAGISIVFWVLLVSSLTLVRTLRFRQSLQYGGMRTFSNNIHRLTGSRVGSMDDDPYDSFTGFEKLLFGRFADSVATELNDGSTAPGNYRELMTMINRMTFTRPLKQVNAQGKNMLVRLFPSWLLPMYKILIQKPLPVFSAVMNCFVTKWTTNWLMGKSKVFDLDPTTTPVLIGSGKTQGLLIEKCRFLESTGCVRTCLHACKVPTQTFFLESMGLPVSLKPNMTDLSCRFEFGVVPLPLDKDPINQQSCLDICAVKRVRNPGACSSCY